MEDNDRNHWIHITGYSLWPKWYISNIAQKVETRWELFIILRHERNWTGWLKLTFKSFHF